MSGVLVPGLLLSFGARLDAAKLLVGISRGGSSSSRRDIESKCCGQDGYFFPLIVAYAIGLAMANTAVYVFQFGQPALLYLVPCTLGTMVYLGWQKGELKQLWDGPRILYQADEILFGPVSSPTTSNSQDQSNPGSSSANASVELSEVPEHETDHVPLLGSADSELPSAVAASASGGL